MRAPRTAFSLNAVLLLIGLLGWTGCVNSPSLSKVLAQNQQIYPWGDQGDGTFRNPILPADFSDPDAIRVENDFYLVASDFHFVGMQVLHSRDLVNWEIVGQVFNRLTMSPKYDAMAGYGEGTWAPTLRYHNGTWFVFLCTPFDGLFMWHAKNPAGPWSDTVTVKAVERWEDPCPFWDDDGKAYLVHSLKGAGPLILHRMSPDGMHLLDDGVEIYRGPTAEGPKLFKRYGWYYISLPEFGVSNGGQTVLRARNIYGPYERREVLPKGSPHQGALIELPNHDWWFVAFKSTGFLGRITYLMPVAWSDDNWPVFGDHGQSLQQWVKPRVAKNCAVMHPQRSDDFTESHLSPIWQWNHNPVEPAWSLSERLGWLRLKPLPAASLNLARNTLTQKLWGERGTIDVKLDVNRLVDGDHAGLAFMSGDTFEWIGVVQTNAVRHVAWSGGEGPAVAGNEVWLRGNYEGDSAKLLYGTDGKTFVDTGATVKLKFAKWKGTRMAIYCYGTEGGSVDVDCVHYDLE